MHDESPPGDTVQKLYHRERALADFGTFAFRANVLQAILDEAARVCAACMNVPFSKICRFQPDQNDLLVVAGYGWNAGVVGYAISVADETTPQGQAFTTGKPQLCPNIEAANTFTLPSFYPQHSIRSTVDVLVAAKSGPPFGVLEVDSPAVDAFDEHDIDFLTGFANILAEAVATAARADHLRQTVARMGELVEEKETLSQELKHRVRNSLHLVYGLLTAELGNEHNEASIAAFRSIAMRVMGLAEVFDHLLGIGMNRVINFGDYISALCANLPNLYPENAVELTCTAQPVRIELDEATAFGIIVTELVNNAYLHAFPDGVGKISVELRVDEGRTVLTVADNGVGFQEVETKRRGVGLVRRLVHQVGASMTMVSDHGIRWTIVLPDGGSALSAEDSG